MYTISNVRARSDLPFRFVAQELCCTAWVKMITLRSVRQADATPPGTNHQTLLDGEGFAEIISLTEIDAKAAQQLRCFAVFNPFRDDRQSEHA